MSEREEIQNKLIQHLEKNSSSFNAPYGILNGLYKLRNGGKIRTITFGVSRYLDATIEIYSPNKIVVKAQGGLAYKCQGEYKNSDEVLKMLDTFVSK